MFKKILASVGIGAAKVDTILETEHLQPGQLFNAQIVISAGDVSQEIAGLDLMLVTRVKVASEDGDYFTNHVIAQWRITDRSHHIYGGSVTQAATSAPRSQSGPGITNN